ncbi:AAA family ATPase [Uniformispora flossi]|uniref:AAA family ATPase n=1 Tax=Uniformispora flossi TaxID=3390723 RepID=UPI003C2EBF80
MARERRGWDPAALRKAREALGLTAEDAARELRGIARRHHWDLAADAPTLAAHEVGAAYPNPHERRAYCLLYQSDESRLGWRNPVPGDTPPAAEPHPPGSSADVGEQAVGSVLAVVAPGVPEVSAADFRNDVVGAWRRRRGAGLSRRRTTLTLVGGYAGSGKSELARFLGMVTAWAVLDKDTLTRPMVEQLLRAYGADPDDRHSELYTEHVRPYEYRCLMDTAWDNLRCGVSVILDAPFVGQFSNPEWMRGLTDRCAAEHVTLHSVWVASDPASMREHIEFRGTPRDAGKLRNWDTYAAGLDPEMRPVTPHFVVDNRHGTAVALADRAREAIVRGGNR